MNTEKLIAALCADVMEIPRDGVTLDTPLDPWDSLCVISTIAIIDELYGRVVNGSALSDCKTVGDVVRLAEAA